MDPKVMKTWVKSVGGPTKAALKIQEMLECSLSKANKIQCCRYPSTPTPAEQKLLAKLVGRSRDVLFPLLAQGKDQAS